MQLQPVERLVDELRLLLDARALEPVTLAEASATIGASVSQLVRAFSGAFGLTPHAYVVGRRVERARRLVLTGVPVAEAAVAAGFHDRPTSPGTSSATWGSRRPATAVELMPQERRADASRTRSGSSSPAAVAYGATS